MKKHDIRGLYDIIFSVPFLIRYGYYDVKMKKVDSNRVGDNELEEHYGDADSFYLKLLGLQDLSFLVENVDLRGFFNFGDGSKNLDTEPINFNIPKKGFVRREYKMPNIYSYLQLCYFLEDNKEEFISVFEQNIHSTSKYFNELDFDFKFTKKLEQRLLFGGNKLLSLDLSSFYHTLYTHSIPWVVHGKQESKSNRNTGFPNNLDNILQNCQYGETHGIPTGSITSRLIAELYMCYIDKKLLDKGYKYARYVDDIKYPFSTDEEKENFLMEFNSICREYNLILNDKKTSISEFPFKNDRQKIDIFSFFDGVNNKSKVSTWTKRINEFIDLCLGEEANENKGAIKCIYSVSMNKFKNVEISAAKLNKIFLTKEAVTNFNIYEKYLDVSLKDSRMTNKFITFTEQLIELDVDKDNLKKIVRAYFKDNISIYRKRINNCIENGWNQEVYQILLYSVIFSEKNLISKTTLERVLRSDLDDYCKCLSMILWLKKKCKVADMLKILEETLQKVHSSYDDQKSARMQEKYWLLRYFIFYLVDINLIKKSEIQKHYKGMPKRKNGTAKSELNKKYVLELNKTAQVNKINEFYELLLSQEVPLVQVYSDSNLFEYL